MDKESNAVNLLRCSFCLQKGSVTQINTAPPYVAACSSCVFVNGAPIKLEYLENLWKLENDPDYHYKMVYRLFDHGSLSLVNCSGNEDTIIRAARVCVGKDIPTKWDVRDKLDFLGRLYRWGHLTPFEHVNLTFVISCPIFVFRQWVRHRTASLNERSGRYAPCLDKELSSITDDVSLRQKIQDLYCKIDALYHELIESGVPKENARVILPLSTYTSVFWTIDLRNLLHFLNLRCDPSAQYQIRMYSLIIRDYILRDRLPLVWEVYRRKEDAEGKEQNEGG